MKYKTLFRTLLKLIGVWVVVEGVGGVFGQFGSGAAVVLPHQHARPARSDCIGLYLFLGGQWIADKAIPGNHPYCHECGYDLTNAAGNLCSE